MTSIATAINGISRLLFPMGAFQAYRAINRKLRRIPIVTYHSITKRRSKTGYQSCLELLGMAVSEDTFERQIRYIKKHYNVIDLEHFVDFLIGKQDQIPDHAIVVTFDDGLADNYTLALPVLNTYRCRATFFIIGNALDTQSRVWPHHIYFVLDHLTGKQVRMTMDGKRIFQCQQLLDTQKLKLISLLKKIAYSLAPDERRRLLEDFCCENGIELDVLLGKEILFMHRRQIREIIDTGHSVGAHSMNHEDLASVGPETMTSEVRGSKMVIGNLTSPDIYSFAYPYGTRHHFNSSVIDCLRLYGFDCALTTVEGLNGKSTNPYALKRIEIGPFNDEEFVAHLSGAIGDSKSIIRNLLMRE